MIIKPTKMKQNLKISILGTIILAIFLSLSCYPEYRSRHHNESNQGHHDRDRDNHDNDHH